MENIWICCNEGREEVIYPDDIMEYWRNNSISAIHICNS